MVQLFITKTSKMKTTLISIFFIINICGNISAQKFQPITVKAGTSLNEYFPASERYLYPEFTMGKGNFVTGGIIPCKFNLNLLTGEIEFVQSKDTVLIAKKQEIVSIVVAQDTFYYHEGYLQLIRNGKFQVFLKRGLEIKDIRKEGAMGTVNRSSASESYSFIILGKRPYDLKPSEDVIIQKTVSYFFSVPGNSYVLFTKKNILKLANGKEAAVKSFIKSSKTDFEEKEDILKLADFVNKLLFP